MAADRESSHSNLRDPVISLITQGFAIVKLTVSTQTHFWAALDGVAGVPKEIKQEFSFSDRTDGFLPQGGERAKYTENVDLCDRFCFWHKHREFHAAYPFSNTTAYQQVRACEAELSSIAQDLISGLWAFFHSDDRVSVRDSSYLQLCMYEDDSQADDRIYLQDRHEDGHLITLIKPTRDGLVIFPNDVETSVHLADDEIIVITGSLLTLLSDGQIPTMFHAVRNPKMRLSRKALVYFAIPDLAQTYTTVLGKKRLDIADFANESHLAFGNTPLL